MSGLDRSSTMVIDMNVAKLGTIEQIREFLAGTADLTFTVPTEEAKRRRFVVTVVGASAISASRKGNEARCLLICSASPATHDSICRDCWPSIAVARRCDRATEPTGPALPASSPRPMWRCWRSSTLCTTRCRARRPRCWRIELLPASVMRAMPDWPRFGIAPVQPARQRRLSRTPPRLAKDQAIADHHRRTQSARAARAARLHPHRYRAPG